MSFGKKLKELRESNKMLQIQLANKIGLKNGNAISNYETDTSKPHLDTFIKICKMFDVAPNNLLEDELSDVIYSTISLEIQTLFNKYNSLSFHDKQIVDYILNMPSKVQEYSNNTINLIDMGEIIFIDTYIEKVSAGKGNVVISGEKEAKLYPSTKISSKADYCVVVSGDSMYPSFVDGDVLYVRKTDILNGDLGIFTYNGESYFKKYCIENGVEKLISLNNNYKSIVIQDNTLIKQGKVIGKFHSD